MHFPKSIGDFKTIDAALRKTISPASVGLEFQPVREQALAASSQAVDFGQLFIGFSFFLIIAALLLMGLLFQFGLEQRAREIGTLLALGFRPRQVRRLFLREGAALALAGGVIGAAGGIVVCQGDVVGLDDGVAERGGDEARCTITLPRKRWSSGFVRAQWSGVASDLAGTAASSATARA